MTAPPDSLRARMMREMHQKAGCRLDDAAACADIALRFMDELRREVVIAYSLPAMSIRQIAKKKNLSKSRVHQIVSIPARGEWTEPKSTLPHAA